jgi:hypothetical protein
MLNSSTFVPRTKAKAVGYRKTTSESFAPEFLARPGSEEGKAKNKPKLVALLVFPVRVIPPTIIYR